MPISANENYRREEDRKWRDRVDEKLVNLVSAQSTTDDQLNDLELRLEASDEIIRGDGKTDSLIEEIHRLQNEMQMVKRVLQPDYEGKRGMINDVRELMEMRKVKERREENHWKFYIAMIGLIGTLSILAAERWDRIKGAFSSGSGASLMEVKFPKAPRHLRHIRKPEPVVTEEEPIE